MNLPFVSVMTCTFGRPALLEEAIESFLRQDYQGPKEMVIFNSFVPQKLISDRLEVRVVNWHSRPSNLGECRNLCIEHCKGSHILVLDDDDLIRPHYMRMCVEDLLRENLQWVKSGGMIHTADRKIDSARDGAACNQFLFSKDVWNKVGKYPQRNAGEDRVFEERLDANGGGKRVSHPLKNAGYVYGWGSHDGLVWHISHGGEDESPHRPSGTIKLQQYARDLLSKSRMPRGDILLRPHWKQDYEAVYVDWCKQTGKL